MQFASALLILWVSFYVMGHVLLLIPSTYHDSANGFLQQLETMEQERKANQLSEDESAAPVPEAEPRE